MRKFSMFLLPSGKLGTYEEIMVGLVVCIQHFQFFVVKLLKQDMNKTLLHKSIRILKIYHYH
jgi:hypothetical protein